MPELNAEQVSFRVYEKLKKRGFKITEQGRSALLRALCKERLIAQSKSRTLLRVCGRAL